MFGQYLISFREVLEAALITSIILVYLKRTGKEELLRYVWSGVIIAVLASITMGLFVWIAYGEFSGESMKLFEGVTALIAVAVLTSMIIWMATKGKYLKEELQSKLGTAVKKGSMLGLMGLAFIIVFREGFETVLFLTPFMANDMASTMTGAALGIISSSIIAYAIFGLGIRIKLGRLFYFSSILLIFLAAGLAGYGTHELIEYQEVTGAEVGWFGSNAFDLGIQESSILHHKGVIGSVLAVMFGYSASMEWGRLIVHVLYIAVFIPLTIISYKKPEIFGHLIRLGNKIRQAISFPQKGTTQKNIKNHTVF